MALVTNQVTEFENSYFRNLLGEWEIKKTVSWKLGKCNEWPYNNYQRDALNIIYS